MLRKRYIIETINNMLKNMAQIVHSRHRSVNDFIMNLIFMPWEHMLLQWRSCNNDRHCTISIKLFF